MSERVGGHQDVAIFEPVLEFGAKNHANVVFDYALTPEAARAGVLMDAVAGLEAAGKLGTATPDALTTDNLASMVKASGTKDLSLPTLGALGEMKAGNFEAALMAFNQYRGQFTVPQKGSILDGLERLKESMPGNVGQIQQLMEAVLDC